jgi:hypothetical protein
MRQKWRNRCLERGVVIDKARASDLPVFSDHGLLENGAD